MEQLRLPPEKVEEWWPGLVSLVPEALHSSEVRATEIKEALIAQTLGGILVIEGEHLLGFITIKFRQESDGLFLDVVTLGGVRMHTWWKEALENLEMLAQKAGATAIEFYTKRNARHFCTRMGFEPVAVTYRKVLK